MRAGVARMSGVFILLSLVVWGIAWAGGVGISTDADYPPDSTLSETNASDAFLPYRPGTQGTLRYRDLELQWDAQYPNGLDNATSKTLTKLGGTLVDSLRNPFHASFADYRLVYDYFRLQGAPYNASNPYDSTSVVVGQGFLTTGYPARDRSHVDYYLFKPGHDSRSGGQYPSYFNSANEDTSTGTSTSRHGNSVMYIGPGTGSMVDTTGSGWTAPDEAANFGFIHEFQHSLPDQIFGWSTELFSAGAEAVGGISTAAAVDEFPYTWSLLGYVRSGLGGQGNSCDSLRAVSSNYAGRRGRAHRIRRTSARSSRARVPRPLGLGRGCLAFHLRTAHREILRRFEAEVGRGRRLRGLL